MSFVHLHVHTQYSILDGAANIDNLFKAAKADGQRALAITDHGNMFGVKSFLESASKYREVKPIVGCEVYVAKGSRLDKKGREDLSNWHLVLLAKNREGYKNLIRLSSDAYIEGFYGRPRIDRELLERYSEGLICTSACLGGEIPQALLNGEMERAREAAIWHKELFGEDFYLELQRHETTLEGADRSTYQAQIVANKGLLQLAQELDIKYIATNDVHFVAAEDSEAHDRLICLTTNSSVDDPNRLRYTKQEYLKSQSEMGEIFADLPLALKNTVEIADKVERYDIESPPIMPYFPIPEEFEDSNHYLRELSYRGARARYGELSKEQIERLDFELETIKGMGYPDYFLIVQDFIAEAREMGVLVGPGRGSAAGSVVAYSLKITDIDPLKYNLLFERFLNPDRISLPDIDIDFDDDGRSKILEHVEKKYGSNHVSHVITFGTMAAKSAIRDMARIQNLPLPESDRLAKMIPNRFPNDSNGDPVPVTIDNAIKLVPEFEQQYKSGSPLVRETIEYARKLEGTVRNIGVHACAIIIGKNDLRDYIPIATVVDKESGERIWLSQFEGSQIEKVGMLKMDFLGLKTLSIIRDTLANIKLSIGEVIDIDSIPIDDEKSYQLFSRGDSIATFQFESDGMRKWLRELKPTRFEDLIAMNALYRPGPMEYIPDFVSRKQGLKQIEYDLPVMEEVLSETYGITVYQEQVMILSQKIAGFSKGDADTLRKGIGKKDRKEIDKLKEQFIKGGEGNGHPKEILEKIWKDWEAFAEYAFNKSHSTCYAWLGYQTAYLKANYPSQFMAAVLSRHLNDIEELTKLMDECKRMKIEVLGPDINESQNSFTVNSEGNIRFGLAAIKGVGSNAVASIVEERNSERGNFSSIFNFIERIPLTTVNKRTIEALVFAGALDSFQEIKREQYQLLSSREESFIEALIKYGQKYQLDVGSMANSLFGAAEQIEIVTPEIPTIVEEVDRNELLKREKELVGIYLSAHPLEQFAFEVKHFTTATISDAVEMTRRAAQEEALQQKELIIAGILSNVKTSYTRNGGKPFANFTIEDFQGSTNFALFGRDYESFMQYLQPNTPLLIKAVIAQRYGGGDYELKIKNIRHLGNTKEDFVREVTLTVPVTLLTPQFRRELVKKIKENRGTTTLIVKLVDYQNRVALNYHSEKFRVDLSAQFIDFLESNSVEVLFVPSLSF